MNTGPPPPLKFVVHLVVGWHHGGVNNPSCPETSRSTTTAAVGTLGTHLPPADQGPRLQRRPGNLSEHNDSRRTYEPPRRSEGIDYFTAWTTERAWRVNQSASASAEPHRARFIVPPDLIAPRVRERQEGVAQIVFDIDNRADRIEDRIAALDGRAARIELALNELNAPRSLHHGRG